MELFEAVFQLDVQSSVPKFERYAELIAWLVERNNDNGRIGTFLSLPPKWDSEGYYEVFFEDSSWMLRQRFTDEVVQINQVHDPAHQLSMVVSMNWSLHRAMVRDVTGCNLSEVCRSFFTSLAASAPRVTPNKNRRQGQFALPMGGQASRSSLSSIADSAAQLALENGRAAIADVSAGGPEVAGSVDGSSTGGAKSASTTGGGSGPGADAADKAPEITPASKDEQAAFAPPQPAAAAAAAAAAKE